MNGRCSWARSIAVGLLVTLASAANAQQTAYLVPEKFDARAGDQLALHMESGEALRAKPVAWPTHDVDWFFVRVLGTQENRQQVQPARPEDGFVTVPLVHAGVTLIGMDTRPIVAELPGKDWRAFLKRHLAGGATEEFRPAPGAKSMVRVRRIVSSKTLLRVRDSEGNVMPSATAVSKSGQAVEILPLVDPTAIKVGSDLPICTYIDGSKKPGVKVLAASLTAGKTQEIVADPSGSGHFTLTGPGPWRLEFHHAEPLRDDPQADWVLYSATLTFEVGGAEGGGR